MEARIVFHFGRHICQFGTEHNILVGFYTHIYRVARHHTEGIPADGLIVLCLCGKCTRNGLQIAIRTFKGNAAFERSRLAAEVLHVEQNIFLVGFGLLDIHSIPNGGIGRLAMLFVPDKVHTCLAGFTLVETTETTGERYRLVGSNTHIYILGIQSVQEIRLYGFGSRSVYIELHSAGSNAVWFSNKRYLGFDSSLGSPTIDNRQFGNHSFLAERCQAYLVDIFPGTCVVSGIQNGFCSSGAIKNRATRSINIHQLRLDLQGLLAIDTHIDLISRQHIQYRAADGFGVGLPRS